MTWSGSSTAGRSWLAGRRRPSGYGSGRAGTRPWSESPSVALILMSAASMVSMALVRREQAKTLAEQRKAESAYRLERQHAQEAEARFRLAPPVGRRADTGQRGGAGTSPGDGGAAQAAARVGTRILPGVHRTANERPGRSGRTAGYDAASRDDPGRPGRPPGCRRTLPSGSAVGARRPAARRGPAGEGGRPFGPRRQALGRDLRRPRPCAPAGRACPPGPRAGASQRGRGRLDFDARCSACGSGNSPSSRRGRPPSDSQRSWKRSGSLRGSASGSAQSKRRSASPRCAKCSSARPPRRPASPPWNASWPRFRPTRHDAGQRWPGRRSSAR